MVATCEGNSYPKFDGLHSLRQDSWRQGHQGFPGILYFLQEAHPHFQVQQSPSHGLDQDNCTLEVDPRA